MSYITTVSPDNSLTFWNFRITETEVESILKFYLFDSSDF